MKRFWFIFGVFFLVIYLFQIFSESKMESPLEEQSSSGVNWDGVSELAGDQLPTETELLDSAHVVVNLWSITCKPCIKEMPDLNRLKAEYESKGNYLFIAVTSDDPERVRAFFHRTSNKFDFLKINGMDDLEKYFFKVGKTANFGGVINFKGYPYTLLIKPGGKIDKVLIGASSENILKIERFLKNSIS